MLAKSRLTSGAWGRMRIKGKPAIAPKLLIKSETLPSRWNSKFEVVRASFSSNATSDPQPELIKSKSEDGSSQTIAILGGGISGLATALFLSRALKTTLRLPKPVRICLVEREKRLGGWVKSQRVAFQGQQTETALLESGPRSLRPAGYSGLVMLEMIKSLDLLPRLLKVDKSSPSAKNRFIYYPRSLARLPSSLSSAILALRLPVLKGLLPSVLSEPFVPSRFTRPISESKLEVQRQRERETLQDESVHDFLTRRFGNRKSIPENLVSAVLHGIYAGDSRTLSVRSVLPFLWNTEKRYGSLVRALLPSKWNKRYREPTPNEKSRDETAEKELKAIKSRLGEDFVKQMQDISVYSFPEGVEEITLAMRQELEQDANVDIWSDTECQRIGAPSSSGTIEIQTSNGLLQCSRIISALPSSTLSSILDSASISSQARSLLSHNPASNVGVVNVAISSSDVPPGRRLLGKVEGFGYLVPRSTPNNNDGVLGVVFDSDALPDQDRQSEGSSDTPTKFTVMMGGTTYWPSSKSTIDAASHSDVTLPSESELRIGAMKALSQQLGIPEAALNASDTIVKVQLQRSAIPQYLVGHAIRMKALHDHLSKSAIDGSSWSLHLTLVGASYTGVSLNDCVTHAQKTVERLVKGELRGSVSGLEEFDSLS